MVTQERSRLRKPKIVTRDMKHSVSTTRFLITNCRDPSGSSFSPPHRTRKGSAISWPSYYTRRFVRSYEDNRFTSKSKKKKRKKDKKENQKKKKVFQTSG